MYKKTKNFNKVWMDYFSNKYLPHYRLQNKYFTIAGTKIEYKNSFLVIKDENGKLIKKKIELDQNITWPSYIVSEIDINDAKKCIGDFIWLNDVSDFENFYSLNNYTFSKFEPVRVIDLSFIQNNEIGFPIWMEVESNQGATGFVRYSGDEGRVGFKDHYFKNNPLPASTDKKVIRNILNQQVILGMSERECRIAIGNPSKINNTSSRHGIGKQYIYKKNNGNKIYFQFEYGKLVNINE